MTAWRLTGTVPAVALAHARREVHAAVQLVADAGRSLLPPRTDDSHTSLSWSATIAGFAGEPLPPRGIRVELCVSTLVLSVLDAEQVAVAELALEGWTLEGARQWLADNLDGRVYPGHALAAIELPEALAAERSATTPLVKYPEAAELANYYANASDLLARWASTASPVRTWPHHFDIAVLVAGPHEGQTIGIGLSPGDGSYHEPYWYVTPWPYPEPTRLPPLVGEGEWHTAGWVGAALPASRLTNRDAGAQAAQVGTFFDSAYPAVQKALD